MSQLVRLEGKHTTQNAHCALEGGGGPTPKGKSLHFSIVLGQLPYSVTPKASQQANAIKLFLLSCQNSYQLHTLISLCYEFLFSISSYQCDMD